MVNYLASVAGKEKIFEMRFRSAVTTLGLSPHLGINDHANIGKIEEMQDRIAMGTNVAKTVASKGSIKKIAKAISTPNSIRELVQKDELGVMDIFPFLDKPELMDKLGVYAPKETMKKALALGFVEAVIKLAITGAAVAEKKAPDAIEVNKKLAKALRTLKQAQKDLGEE